MADCEDGDSHQEEIDGWEGVSVVIFIPVFLNQSSSQGRGHHR